MARRKLSGFFPAFFSFASIAASWVLDRPSPVARFAPRGVLGRRTPRADVLRDFFLAAMLGIPLREWWSRGGCRHAADTAARCASALLAGALLRGLLLGGLLLAGLLLRGLLGGHGSSPSGWVWFGWVCPAAFTARGSLSSSGLVL